MYPEGENLTRFNGLTGENKVYRRGMLAERASGVTLGDLRQALDKVCSLCKAVAEQYPDQALIWARRYDSYDIDVNACDSEDDERDYSYYFGLLIPEP